MATAIDPICQMEVDTDNPTGGKSQYGGTTYYFCAPGCKRTFDQDPGKYGTAQPQAAPQKGSFFSRLFALSMIVRMPLVTPLVKRWIGAK